MRHAKQAHTRIPVPARPGACQLTVRDLGVTLEGTETLQHTPSKPTCRMTLAPIAPTWAHKSWLYRSHLGQIPYTGTIKFELAGGYPSHPKIGYVPQSPSFDRSCPISVLDFFAAAISRWPVFLPVPAPLRDKVADCLSRVHGEALLHKRIGTLSGGELQRVLMALALEPLPQILILDEPLSGVDVGGEHLLMDMLDEIRQTYDLSILFSTHDFSTLQQYADKVIPHKSTIHKSGSPAEVLTSPEFRSVFHLDLGLQPNGEGGAAQ